MAHDVDFPGKPMNAVLAAVAAVLLALPAWAQDAGDPADDTVAAEDAAQGAPQAGEEEPPEAAETPAGEQPEATDAEAVEEGTAGGPVVVDIEEGSVLDDQTFEGEDDDFVPSEEIPIDQPIPFPTDI